MATVIESSTQSATIPAKSKSRWCDGLEWSAVIWLGTVHLLALGAPFCFTWCGLGLFLFMSWVTGSLGVCLGFHRLLTHSGFETYRPIRWMLALCGTLAGEGPPIMWVSAHRKHHRFSDQEHDPHSPRDGAWWSHVLWMLPRCGKQHWAQLYRTYAPDLMRDRSLRLLDRTFLWWHLGFAVLTFAIGWLAWDLHTAVSLLFWGSFLRLTYMLHVTWAVNSASHMWGYRNYSTRDNSRNLWWVAMLAFGEGWHNNHHAFPRVAQHGHRWWEFDTTYWIIVLMERTGLAWNVVHNTCPVVSSAPVKVALREDDDVLTDFADSDEVMSSEPASEVACELVAATVAGN